MFRLLNIGRHRVRRVDVPNIRSLPRFQRLLHPKVQRHLVAISLGTTLMLTGSFLATHGENAPHFLPHVVWDALAYFIHGIGSLPILGHIEPMWKLLTD